MKKKIIWLVVSCLMVAVLLIASCAPAVVEEEEALAPSTVTLLVTYRISASSSGTYERTFNRADITDEEIHEIAWDFIVARAAEKGIDPNNIVYDVKINRFHATPPPPEPTRDARDYHDPFPPGPEPDPPRIPSYSDQFPPGYEPPRIPSYSDQFP